MSAGAENPRPMITSEYPEMMDLIEKAYGMTGHYIHRQYLPFHRENSEFVPENNFLIRDQSRLVSMARLYPMTAVMNDIEIAIGGIGAVATHPDARGKGYMSTLMAYACRQMQERHIHLSILWGNTQRYRHFGWERAGLQVLFTVTAQSVKEISPPDNFTMNGFDSAMHLKVIMTLHEAEPWRVKRTLRQYQNLFNSPYHQVWVGTDGARHSYIVLQDNAVVEFGGEPDMIAAHLAYYEKLYPKDLRIYAPCYPSALLDMFYRISQEWTLMPLCMLKIIDLCAILETYHPRLNQRSQYYSLPKGASLTLAMPQSGQTARLAIGETVEILTQGGADSETIRLSDIQMARLLFGGSVENFAQNTAQARICKALFPLEFYVGELDRI